jgi:hypothetical protein
VRSTTTKITLTEEGSLVIEDFARLVNACLEHGVTSVRSPDTDQDHRREALTGVPAGGTRSERELIAEKRPRSQTETVAVLAYCLAENGQGEFTEADIKRAYLRAGVRPPKVIGQAVRDAKNNFDFIESGPKRGTYRLSPHGDRTVRFDLPRGEA